MFSLHRKLTFCGVLIVACETECRPDMLVLLMFCLFCLLLFALDCSTQMIARTWHGAMSARSSATASVVPTTPARLRSSSRTSATEVSA